MFTFPCVLKHLGSESGPCRRVHLLAKWGRCDPNEVEMEPERGPRGRFFLVYQFFWSRPKESVSYVMCKAEIVKSELVKCYLWLSDKCEVEFPLNDIIIRRHMKSYHHTYRQMICRHAYLLKYMNAEIWCAGIHTYEKWEMEKWET